MAPRVAAQVSHLCYCMGQGRASREGKPSVDFNGNYIRNIRASEVEFELKDGVDYEFGARFVF